MNLSRCFSKFIPVTIFFGLFLSSNSYANNANRCENLYDQKEETKLKLKKMGMNIKNPKWVKLLFPGEPENTPVAKLYIKNITNSLVVFVEFFENGVLNSINEFQKMLSLQHEKTILGTNPRNPYSGFYQNTGGLLKQMVDDAILESSRQGGMIDRKKWTTLILNEIKEMAGVFRSEKINIDLSFFLYSNQKEVREQLINIHDEILSNPYIPNEALPTHRITDNNWFHEYPHPENLKYYISAMHKILLKIKTCSSCSRLEILSLLSDYYHTGINAHLFPKVNQALLMSQINYILLNLGYSGISHLSQSDLKITIDGAALIMNSENFKKFFVNEVQIQNEITVANDSGPI